MRDYPNIAAKSEMTAAKTTKAVPISRMNVPRSNAGDGSGALRIASRSRIAAISALVMGDGVGIAFDHREWAR